MKANANFSFKKYFAYQAVLGLLYRLSVIDGYLTQDEFKTHIVSENSIFIDYER